MNSTTITETKQFHLGDILSITTGLLVSPRHIGGVYEILDFMTGDSNFTHQLPRVSDECKPYLIEQFPQLYGDEMELAVLDLEGYLTDINTKVVRGWIVEGWLVEQVAKYGEMFSVSPIPKGAHKAKNPLTELSDMLGGGERHE